MPCDQKIDRAYTTAPATFFGHLSMEKTSYKQYCKTQG